MIGTKNDCIKFLIDCDDGDYEVKKWFPKRSRTANSYYWELLTQLAGELRTSKEELHEVMLQRYGQYLINDDGNIRCMILAADLDPSEIEGLHVEYACDVPQGKKYHIIKGSSFYDSKEMSELIDGLVSECKEVGIPTMPESEFERLKGYVKAN